MDGELHAQPVEQRGEPPRGAVRIVALELTRLDALDDDLLDRVLPREVELLGDVAELAAAHRLTPRVDPQQPPRFALARRVELEDALELLDRGVALCDRRGETVRASDALAW